MSSTDKVAEYFDAHGATEEEKEPMRDSAQKLKSYGIEKVSTCRKKQAATLK